MPIEVSMPRLSDTMERGTIVSWSVKEGDSVSAGMALGDIETDKATMELQSFDSGTVAALLIKEGETVEVGRAILVIAEEGESVAEVKAKYAGGVGGVGGAMAVKKAASTGGVGGVGGGSGAGTAVIEAPASNGRTEQEAGGGRVFASPLAKKVASEMGVELGAVKGTGPAGRIVRKDVESAAAVGGDVGGDVGGGVRAATSGKRTAPLRAPSEAGLEERRVPMSNMRAVIAKRLVQSKATIPHYQVTIAVDMGPLGTLRDQLNEQLASQGVKLSVNDFLVRACALAMREHPFVNSSWGADGQSIDLHERVNIGVAISLPTERGGGLVVATLRDADRMGLRQISGDTRALAAKARERGLSIDEMEGATFTISNLGMFGIEEFTAIINPPNSAILAVGAAIETPVVRKGQIVVGTEMRMTMSSDHRVIDGAMAARYLASVKGLLEAPATLLV